MCAALGEAWSLCTRDQVEKGNCQGKGCGMDSRYTWIIDYESAFDQMEGNGWCQDQNGAEGTARKYLPPMPYQEALSTCYEDEYCVAFAYASETTQVIMYTTTGCILDCDNTQWIENPELVSKAGWSDDQPSWQNHKCYKKRGSQEQIVSSSASPTHGPTFEPSSSPSIEPSAEPTIATAEYIYGDVNSAQWCSESEDRMNICDGDIDSCWEAGMDLCDSEGDSCFGVMINAAWTQAFNGVKLCLSNVMADKGDWLTRMKIPSEDDCLKGNPYDCSQPDGYAFLLGQAFEMGCWNSRFTCESCCATGMSVTGFNSCWADGYNSASCCGPEYAHCKAPTQEPTLNPTSNPTTLPSMKPSSDPIENDCLKGNPYDCSQPDGYAFLLGQAFEEGCWNSRFTCESCCATGMSVTGFNSCWFDSYNSTSCCGPEYGHCKVFEELPGFAYSGPGIGNWASYEQALAGCSLDGNCHGFYSLDSKTFYKGSCPSENPTCCVETGETLPSTSECTEPHCQCKVLIEHTGYTAWVKSNKGWTQDWKCDTNYLWRLLLTENDTYANFEGNFPNDARASECLAACRETDKECCRINYDWTPPRCHAGIIQTDGYDPVTDVDSAHWAYRLEVCTMHQRLTKTFLATGCPNADLTSHFDYWVNLGSSGYTFYDDMYLYCSLTKDGTANKNQMNTCCGTDVDCTSELNTCVKQTSLADCHDEVLVPPAPTSPGCWFFLPTCPSQSDLTWDLTLWHFDDFDIAQSFEQRCIDRADEWNTWCGISNAQMHFVNCEPRDSDSCLQQSPSWSSSYTCAGSTRYCTSYAKDMRRCCPISCGTGSLSEEQCNALVGSSGTCVYPNDAQPCGAEIADQTISPSINPTQKPSADPTKIPSRQPTCHPTIDPTKKPSADPTKSPSRQPTFHPTTDPTKNPTHVPTLNPTLTPSMEPTDPPSSNPSGLPTELAVSVRLVDADGAAIKASSGMLQMWDNEQWKYVCSITFADNDLGSTIACQELGYDYGWSVRENRYITLTNFWDGIACRGDELKLNDCPRSSTSNCRYFNSIRLICSSESRPTITSRLIDPLSGEVSTKREGILQLFARDEWRYVCDDYFKDDHNGVNVACTEMGFITGKVHAAATPGGEDDFWDEVQCDGSESRLTDCPREQFSDCAATEAMSVHCSGNVFWYMTSSNFTCHFISQLEPSCEECTYAECVAWCRDVDNCNYLSTSLDFGNGDRLERGICTLYADCYFKEQEYHTKLTHYRFFEEDFPPSAWILLHHNLPIRCKGTELLVESMADHWDCLASCEVHPLCTAVVHVHDPSVGVQCILFEHCIDTQASTSPGDTLIYSRPTASPSYFPSVNPSTQPTCFPSEAPSTSPSLNPSTSIPSFSPSVQPTNFPIPDGVFVTSLTITLLHDAEALSFQFEHETNATGDCARLFEDYAEVINVARCQWRGPRNMRVYLAWDCTFQIGDAVIIYHPSLTSAEYGSTIYARGTIVSQAEIHPHAITSGPVRTGNCFPETISAEHSKGSGLRPFHYEWSERDNLIDPSCFADRGTLTLPEECYLWTVQESPEGQDVDHTYMIIVTVTNWLGFSDSTIHTLAHVVPKATSMEIPGPPHIFIDPDKYITIDTKARPCEEGKHLQFYWSTLSIYPSITQHQGTRLRNVIDSMSLGQRPTKQAKQLDIQPFELEQDTLYIFNCTTDSGPGENWAVVVIFVKPYTPQPLTKKTIYSTIERLHSIKASDFFNFGKYDVSTVDHYYNISWTCNGTSCGTGYFFPGLKDKDIKELTLECSYVHLKHLNMSGSSEHVYIIFDFSLQIQIETGSEYLNPGREKMVLSAFIVPSDHVWYERWSLPDESVYPKFKYKWSFLNSNISTSTSGIFVTSTPTKTAMSINTVTWPQDVNALRYSPYEIEDLVLHPVLTATMEWGESLELWDQPAIGNIVMQVDMLIEINENPHGGYCSIEPKTGMSYDTVFRVSCYGWNDVHLPLTYNFKSYRQNSTIGTLLGGYTANNEFEFQSAAGNFTIEASIKDTVGGEATFLVYYSCEAPTKEAVDKYKAQLGPNLANAATGGDLTGFAKSSSMAGDVIDTGMSSNIFENLVQLKNNLNMEPSKIKTILDVMGVIATNPKMMDRQRLKQMNSFMYELVTDMVEHAGNLPPDFINSALTTVNALTAATKRGSGNFSAQGNLDESRELLNGLIVGGLMHNIVGEPGTNFESDGFVLKASKASADNLDKDACGGGVFNLPKGSAGGAAEVNCGFSMESGESYEETTGQKMSSQVTSDRD